MTKRVYGEISKGGKAFEQVRVANERAYKPHGTVVIRERNPNTYGDGMRLMLARRLTFQEAIRLGEFSFVSKQRQVRETRRGADQLQEDLRAFATEGGYPNSGSMTSAARTPPD